MLITLKNQTSSAIIDTLGAQLISLKDASGQEYIWQRDPAFWSSCSPLLFPAIGNSRNGKTIIEDEWYDMPKHGFCKTTDFQVKNQSDTCATFWIQDTEVTKTMYPYAFLLSLTYTLTEDGIFMDYQVENTDEKKIYYSIGSHPGFNCPLEEGEKFEDYLLEFEQEETASAMVYDESNHQFNREHYVPLLKNSRTLPLRYPLFDQDAVYFDDLLSRKVSILHSKTRKGVEVDYAGFDSVAFWTPRPGEAPFLCVEPWNGSAICSDEDDYFVHKHHIQQLEPGEKKNYHLGIRIL